MHFLAKREPDWHRIRVPCRSERLPSHLRLRRYTVSIPYASGAGQTVAFFSDLHWTGRHVERADALVRAINLAEPEWIVFGGDLIRYLCDCQSALRILQQLCARRGKLAVLGNRERVHTWRPPEEWIELYAKAGFTCLINETCVPAGDENPVFVGLDDMRYGAPDPDICLPFLGSRRTVVMLSHTPDTVGLFRHRFAGHVLLSGHTHGGQLRVPLLGPAYTSSAYGRQFDRGWLGRSDGAQLYVTTGTGETGYALLRRRVHCPPEIALLTFEQTGIASTLRMGAKTQDQRL